LSPFRIDANAIFGECEDAEREADRIFDWRQARLSIGGKNGLVDKQGHATTRYSSRVLQKARREGAQRDDTDVVELGTVTRPIPRGRQIPSACHRTGPATLVAAFRDSIQENLNLPLGL
jgi:hypothetical protein